MGGGKIQILNSKTDYSELLKEMLFKAFFTGCLLMTILFMTIKETQYTLHSCF